MAPRKIGLRWNFDLVSVSPKGVELLPCVVWGDMVPKIDAQLCTRNSSLDKAMTSGMVLTLKGSLWLNAEGTVGMRVTAIEPGFVRRGALYLEDNRAIASLRAAGVPGSRLARTFVHDNPENAFKNLDCKPERVMVVGPANAQGVGDLERRLSHSGGSSPEVFYRTLSWSVDAKMEDLQAHLREAEELDLDLVLLVRGGGHWRWLRGYQRADLGLAILRSSVPVATAVGHDADVSVADRAASLSFTTPTAAAEAIANELAFHRRQQTRAMRHTAERRIQAEDQAAEEATLASFEARIGVLQTNYETAQQRVSEANSRQHNAFKVHTQDLLDTAEMRVKFVSRTASVAVLMAVTAMVVFNDQLLANLQLSPDSLQGWLYRLTIIATGVWLLVWQRRARNSAGLASTSPMKEPPRDVDSWRFAMKRVRTVRKLRRLRHHTPL